jgi:hypothetical protein
MQTNAGGTAAEFASNIDVPGTLDVTGVGTFDANLLFNSGYGSAAVAYGVRAWATYNGVTNTLISGANVSSVTRVVTGKYQFNFITPMPDANYSFVVLSGGISNRVAAITTTSAQVTTSYPTDFSGNDALYDVSGVNMIVVR